MQTINQAGSQHMSQTGKCESSSPFLDILNDASRAMAVADHIEDVAQRLAGALPEYPVSSTRPRPPSEGSAVDALLDAHERINHALDRIQSAAVHINNVLP
jgi:hypothetical protein